MHIPTPPETLRESDIEKRLVRDVHRAGGRCYKWRSANTNGIPDRLCVFPHRVFGIAEIKAPGKPLSPLQAQIAAELAALGVRVWLIDSYEDAAEFIAYHLALSAL